MKRLLFLAFCCLPLHANASCSFGGQMGEKDHKLEELDDFWGMLKAGPTPEASVEAVTKKFGETPFNFCGPAKTHQANNWANIRINRIGFDGVELWSRAPVVRVDTYVIAPLIDQEQRKVISITVNRRPP